MKYKSHRARAEKRLFDKLGKRLSLAGDFVTGAAKLLAPVDTGNLRSSISHKRSEKFTERIGTGVEYAGFLEYGTRFMRARPYLFPALIDNRREVKNILTKGN